MEALEPFEQIPCLQKLLVPNPRPPCSCFLIRKKKNPVIIPPPPLYPSQVDEGESEPEQQSEIFLKNMNLTPSMNLNLNRAPSLNLYLFYLTILKPQCLDFVKIKTE